MEESSIGEFLVSSFKFHVSFEFRDRVPVPNRRVANSTLEGIPAVWCMRRFASLSVTISNSCRPLSY